MRDNPTSYDAAYAALVEAVQASLLINDQRPAQASGPRCHIEVLALPV
jgi:predicted nucleic acid-binding protein